MGFFDRLRDLTHTSKASGPMGPDGTWEAVPELTDEFEGESVDNGKWEPFNKNWKGRAPGWFNPENVTVNDGALNLACRVEEPPSGYPEQFHTFSTAFVRSKATLRYGFVEAMLQPADSITSSSMWLVHNDRQEWNEIDVFEVSQARGHERKYHMNAHLFRTEGVKLPKTLSKPLWVELKHRTCEQPFLAGLEWTPEAITWYVDGKAVRREPNEHWHHDMFLQFDSETMPKWFGLPDVGDERLPAVFEIMGVRTWRRVED